MYKERQGRTKYHKIASDVLSRGRPHSAVDALLEAAEIGNDKKVFELISKYRTLIDLKCVSTGETALIAASRNGHIDIVDYLLSSGADPTLQNDNGENALKVAPPQIKSRLLAHVAKDRPSTAQQLLQAAWLGDAVTVKKNLSGNVINVNCKNSEGLTPLLLVTRDINTFNKVQKVMQTDYNPIGVVQELLKHNADVEASDSHGKTALHLISDEGGGRKGGDIQAKKVVSLLLQSGSSTNTVDDSGYTPLHVAASKGHTAIIVALIEEGNANVDVRGGDNKDTPLMLSAREGHKETAEYLLSKGADITLTDESGDTALNVAKTPSMIKLLNDAWTEKSKDSNEISKPFEDSEDEEEEDDDDKGSSTAFFITQNKTSSKSVSEITRLESVDGHDERKGTITPEVQPLSYSEAEADDEQEDNRIVKRYKPATRRTQVRQTMLTKSKKNSTNTLPHGQVFPLKTELKTLSLSKSMESLSMSGRSTAVTPTGNTPTHSKRSSLPAVSQGSLRAGSLSGATPLALLSVDAEKEKFQFRSIKQTQSKGSIRKKTSMPHLQLASDKNSASKVPLLPAVVAPHLSLSSLTQPSSHSKLLPLRLKGSSSTTGLTNSTSLTVLSEEPDKTLTPSDHKHFEGDTLRQAAMIWKTEPETSSCDDYITSYIGSRTPFPYHLLSPGAAPKISGRDSGHEGETDDDDDSSSNSEETEEEEEKEELRWKRGKLLGKGAYGKVFEGLLDTAKLIAVKEVELEVEEWDKAEVQFKKIQLEVDILRSLSHRNIVQYLGAAIDQTIIFIFMEYISGGSLQSILKRFGALDERTTAHYSRQIAKGLNYLHNNGVIHRDIKGANIMVTSKGVVKLIDFGCAKRHCLEQSMGMHSVRGTPYWMAPEIICGHGYGRKSDIWSFGCTVYEMVSTKPPWGDLPPEAAMFKIGLGQALPPLPKQASQELKLLYTSCLKSDPGQRPTAQEVLDHFFFAKTNVQTTASEKRKNSH